MRGRIVNLTELLNSDMTTLARHARAGFDWWIGELRAMLPERLVRGAALRSWHRYERGAVLVASDATADTVVVPQDLCLVRTLNLPRMGRADVAALVALDMDRIMPVAPDSIVTGIAVVGPAAEGDMQSVRVGAMARRDAVALADALGEAGVTPRQVGPLDADGAALAFDLAPAMRAAGLLPPLSQARRFWWSAVAVLVLVNVGTAILQDRQQVQHVQDLVDAQAPAINAVRRIEDRLQDNARRVTTLDRRRHERQPLRLLAAVDAALPANAWVQRLEWDGQRVRLSGFAADDVNVVAAFKQSGRFVTVRSNRAEAMGQERTGRPFDLTAALPEGPR